MSESKITQKALAIAMKELMTALPFTKISVQDICQKCGISRKSFYYHFRDKYDLISWIFYTEYLCVAANKKYNDCWQYLLDLCEYLYRNKTFYLRAFAITGQNAFTEYFYEVSRPYISDFLEPMLFDNDNNRSYMTFFADIPLLAIIRWLQSSEDKPDQFIRSSKAAVQNIAKLIDQDADDPAST
jgi:probable dihydroxyacetone kinase regulator